MHRTFTLSLKLLLLLFLFALLFNLFSSNKTDNVSLAAIASVQPPHHGCM